MLSRQAVTDHSETLVELLAAQCEDLERLLALARREEEAARAGDFEGLMEVVGGRAEVGARLETYHRRVAELRARLGDAAEAELRGGAARRAAELVAAVRAHDARTRPLLEDARADARQSLARVNTSRAGLGAYLHDSRGAAGGYTRRC
jgi:hypothetical protein